MIFFFSGYFKTQTLQQEAQWEINFTFFKNKQHQDENKLIIKTISGLFEFKVWQ